MSQGYWEKARDDGQRAVDYANSQLKPRPGEIGGVLATPTTDMGDIPPEQLGDHPVIHYDDRHRAYEDDFNALTALAVEQGRIPQDVAERAMANFHDAMRATQLGRQAIQTSPTFYQ